MQLHYIYETTLPWEPDAHIFPGSAASTLGMTTELVVVRDGQIADEGEREAWYELLIVRRGDGFAFAWEVVDGASDETLAKGFASTLTDAKRAAEMSAWHSAERTAGRRIQSAEDWIDEATIAVLAAINVQSRRG